APTGRDHDRTPEPCAGDQAHIDAGFDESRIEKSPGRFAQTIVRTGRNQITGKLEKGRSACSNRSPSDEGLVTRWRSVCPVNGVRDWVLVYDGTEHWSKLHNGPRRFR